MHVQDGAPNWTDALSHLPDGGLVLSVHNLSTPGIAKRVNPKLITAFRHFFDHQPIGADYGECVAIWRSNFRRFVSPASVERYFGSIDLVLEYNEYYDEGMATNTPEAIPPRLANATAAANVWNDEFRGRGGISPSCRLVIGNSPVGNNIPKAFAQLAIATDNVLGYHPYQRVSARIWPETIRDPGDWRFHSGRWNFMEQAWGLRPRWCFTETMPYMGSAEGWRNWVVLDGDEELLVEIFRAWLRDVATTDAYREGRILGTGAWFTIGGGDDWDDYELERDQLVRLADVAAALWRPGQEKPMPTPDEAAIIHTAMGKLDEAKALLAPLAAPKHTLVNLTNQKVFDLFKRAFGAAAYYGLVVIACDEAYMLAHRPELYHGAAIEDMPGLTTEQKAALIGALPA